MTHLSFYDELAQAQLAGETAGLELFSPWVE